MVCVCDCVYAEDFFFCLCVRMHVCVREKQLIIEFNRRNTVYPERQKASGGDTEEKKKEEKAWGK